MLPFLIIHLYLDGMWLMCGSKNTHQKYMFMKRIFDYVFNSINYYEGDGLYLITFI